MADKLRHFVENLFALAVAFGEIFRADIYDQYHLLAQTVERDNFVEQHQINVFEVLIVPGVEL